MNVFHSLISLLLLISTTSLAITQERLSLSDAIATALENNYDIRIINRNEEITEINNTWGSAGLLPTISFGLSSSNRANFNEVSDYTSTTLTPDLSLNWTLFNGFSIRIMKQKLEALAHLSKGNTAVLVEQTIQSVILVYYKVLLEQEKLDVVREVMDLSSDRYDYVIAKKEIGSAVTYDVLLAKSAWLEDKAAFLFQDVILSNAIRDLSYMMGVTFETDYTFTEKFASELRNYEWETLLDKMLSNNKTLRNQYIQEMLLEKEVALAKSLYYPSFSLRSGVDASSVRTKYEGASATTSKLQNLSAILTLSYSLFDGGIKKRALRISKIQEETVQIETAGMKHSLTNQLAKLLDLYNVRKDLYNVAEENIETSSLNMQISEDKFRVGAINSFNYRDVQLIYLNASINRLQAIYNLIDVDTALARITGVIVTEE